MASFDTLIRVVDDRHQEHANVTKEQPDPFRERTLVSAYRTVVFKLEQRPPFVAGGIMMPVVTGRNNVAAKTHELLVFVHAARSGPRASPALQARVPNFIV